MTVPMLRVLSESFLLVFGFTLRVCVVVAFFSILSVLRNNQPSHPVDMEIDKRLLRMANKYEDTCGLDDDAAGQH